MAKTAIVVASDAEKAPGGPERRLLTRSELAEAFQINPGVITRWQQDGLPVAQRGGPARGSKYDLAACLAWWQQKQLGKFSAGNGQAISLEVERAKLARAQTEKAELDAQARKGQLLAAEEVREAWTAIMTAVKSKLLAIPRALAPQLVNITDAAVIEARLRAKVHEALSELAAGRAKSRRRKTSA